MLTFDEESHTYRVDGEVKRSVTQILKDVGASNNYSGVDEYYRDRGDRAHAGCVLLAQGWLDWDSVDEDILHYVKNFDKVIKAIEFVYEEAEEPYYDKDLDYCGTPDIRGKSKYADKTLLELKTAKTMVMNIGLQTAAYLKLTGDEKAIAVNLSNAEIWLPTDEYMLNHVEWDRICTGKFDLKEWKSNKGRRYMGRVK